MTCFKNWHLTLLFTEARETADTCSSYVRVAMLAFVVGHACN